MIQTTPISLYFSGFYTTCVSLASILLWIRSKKVFEMLKANDSQRQGRTGWRRLSTVKGRLILRLAHVNLQVRSGMSQVLTEAMLGNERVGLYVIMGHRVRLDRCPRLFRIWRRAACRSSSCRLMLLPRRAFSGWTAIWGSADVVCMRSTSGTCGTNKIVYRPGVNIFHSFVVNFNFFSVMQIIHCCLFSRWFSCSQSRWYDLLVLKVSFLCLYLSSLVVRFIRYFFLGFILARNWNKDLDLVFSEFTCKCSGA